MTWQSCWDTPFSLFLNSFAHLIGDKRTARTFNAIIYGIIAAGSTVCQRIAAHSPLLAMGKRGAQRVIRFCCGDSTLRSQLDAEHLTAQLRERAVQHLAQADSDELWLIADGSDLRKPYAHKLPYLQKVLDLDKHKVNGYPTINVLGLTPGRRGILYHRLFSANEPGFLSEPAEVQQALRTVSAAIAPLKQHMTVTWIMDRRFDDVAVWSTIWQQQEHFVCRCMHPERLVSYQDRRGNWQQGDVAAAAGQVRTMGTAETVLEIRLSGQKSRKRQPVTVSLSACRLELSYQPTDRFDEPGPQQSKPLWLLQVRIQQSNWEPWLLITDWAIETAEDALRIFAMYRQRWSVEESFKFSKECVHWEEVQLLDLQGIRTLVALAWVAAGFLYELGVSWACEEVQLLARLGGFEVHKDRKPGKIVLKRGLERLLEMLATAALLEAYEAEHGGLPPKIAAFLGRLHPPSDL
jgi:hypothetical protein